MQKLLFLTFIVAPLTIYNHNQQFFKYNTCDFKQRVKDVEMLHGVSLIRYSLLDYANKENRKLSKYYLIKSGQDTLNMISISEGPQTDSTIKKYLFIGWSFHQMKESCFDFYSNIDLEKATNNKYPVVFGSFFFWDD